MGSEMCIRDRDEAYEYAKSWFHSPFDFVIFELPTKEQDISLSWHLTTREKRLVENSVNLDANLKAMEKLLELLSTENRKNATPLLVEKINPEELPDTLQ